MAADGPLTSEARRDLWERFRAGEGAAREGMWELLRGAYDAVSRGDIDTMLEGFDPEVEFVPNPTMVGVAKTRGHAALREFYEEFLAAFDAHVEPEAMHRAGERLVVVVHVRVKGRTGGVELDLKTGDVLTFAPSGYVVRWQPFQTAEEAMAEVGLG